MSLIKCLVYHFLHVLNPSCSLACYWCSSKTLTDVHLRSLFNFSNEYNYLPIAHLLLGISRQFPIIRSVCIPLTRRLLVSVAQQRPPELCGPHIHFMPRGCQEHNWSMSKLTCGSQSPLLHFLFCPTQPSISHFLNIRSLPLHTGTCLLCLDL